MKIVAIDLGKVKSVACEYASQTGEHLFETCRTTPEALEEMLVRRRPDRVVIEVCPSRRKIAIVAVARRLLVWCWAMLRDDRDWCPKALAAA